jgi:hypothetical protein
MAVLFDWSEAVVTLSPSFLFEVVAADGGSIFLGAALGTLIRGIWAALSPGKTRHKEVTAANKTK